MSKAIASYPESERQAVVTRRLAQNAGGLGYLSAVAYAGAVKAENARVAANRAAAEKETV